MPQIEAAAPSSPKETTSEWMLQIARQNRKPGETVQAALRRLRSAHLEEDILDRHAPFKLTN